MGREGGWAIKVIKWTLLFLRFHSQRSPRLGVPFACSVCLPSTLSGLSTLHNPFSPIVCARMFFTRLTLVSLKRFLVPWCWEAYVTAGHKSQYLWLGSVQTQSKIPSPPPVFQFFHLSDGKRIPPRGRAENSADSQGFEPAILRWLIQVPSQAQIWSISPETLVRPRMWQKAGSECCVLDALLDTTFGSGGLKGWRSALVIASQDQQDSGKGNVVTACLHPYHHHWGPLSKGP